MTLYREGGRATGGGPAALVRVSIPRAITAQMMVKLID